MSSLSLRRKPGLATRGVVSPAIAKVHLLIIALLFASIAASVASGETASATVFPSRTYYASTPGDWADSETWSSDDQGLASTGKDPGGQVVVSTTVYLTVNVTVASVAIVAGGVLSCDRRAKYPVTLTTARIVIERGGCFSCTGGGSGGGATPTCTASAAASIEPYTGPRFTVSLASSRPPGSADDDVRTLLVKNGGALVLAGGRKTRNAAEGPATTTTTASTSSITRLAEHAMAGATEIVVADADSSIASTWRPGDRIAIAPTDYHPNQTEYFGILAVASASASPSSSSQPTASSSTTARLVLDAPLKYARTGKAYGLVHPTSSNPPNQTFVIDARAEVALLTRNIVVQGTPDDPRGLRGDVKVTGSDTRVDLSGVAFNNLGRRGHMGRYPLHFHGMGSGGGKNVRVSSVVVHRSSQRGIVVHCTSGATFSGNVVANVEGFAFMLEDGAEENNVFDGNLAIDVRPPDTIAPNSASLVTERDNTAGFWFLNAANTFVGNVAAGVQGSGFVLDLDPKLIMRPATYTLCPEQVPGFNVQLLAEGTGRSAALLGASVYRALAAKTFARFENNVVHAAHTGLWVSSLPQPKAGFFVDVDSFTAWKIAPRLGGKVAFDACVRLSGVQGLRLDRLACANTALSYWSTESGVVTNTLLAWLTDGGGVGGGSGGRPGTAAAAAGDQEKFPTTPATPQLVPSGARWHSHWASRHGGLQSYLSSQAFVGTYAYGSFPPGPLSTDFSVSASGALTGAHNLVAGFRRDADSAAPSPVLALDARMQHAYTDVTGELLGGGGGAATSTATAAAAAGMRALCNCAACGTDQLDPLIAAYASGQCTVVVSTPPNAQSPFSAIITCAGAASSLLCRPSFVTVEIRGVARPSARVVGPQQEQPLLLRVEAPANHHAMAQTSPSSSSSAPWSRSLERNGNAAGASTWRFLAPMTKASVDELAGGYRFRGSGGAADWGASLASLVVVVGHTTDPRGGLTLVVSRVPQRAVLHADAYPWRDTEPRIGAGASSTPKSFRITDALNGLPSSGADQTSCPSLLRSSCQPAPAPCVCQSALGGNDQGFKDIYVRFRTWGEMDASIFDHQGRPYLYKLAKYQVRIQLDPQNPTAEPAAAAAAVVAAVTPPEDLFASLNTALQYAPK